MIVPPRPSASSLLGAVTSDPRMRPNPLVPISAAGGQMGSQMASAAAQAPAQDSRARLAEAILKATGGGQPQEVQHPAQAIGNATQQIAAARLQRQQARTPPVIPGANSPAGPARAMRPKRPQSPHPMRPMGYGGQYRRPILRPGG